MSRLIRDRVHKSLQQVERRGVEGAAAQGDFGSKERLEILPGKLHPAEGMELEKKTKKLNAVSSKHLLFFWCVNNVTAPLSKHRIQVFFPGFREQHYSTTEGLA